MTEALQPRRGNPDAARTEYHAQPLVKELADAELTGWSDGPEQYMCTRDVYCTRASAARVQTFAVVKDGRWYERGEMGWWGVVKDEKDDDVWRAEYAKLVDGLPDNTLLAVYDCHI